jgi:hypothetical protein
MSNEIKICQHCFEPLNEKIPTSKYQFLCDRCYSDKLIFVKATQDIEGAPKYRTARKSVLKYLLEDVKEYMDKNDIELVESHQSDNYGFMSDKHRSKVIKKVCKMLHLNVDKVLQDHYVDYFITYGLHIYNSDEEFLRSIHLNKYFHTNLTPKRPYSFNLEENDFTGDF